jgi:hypothetical protein
MNQKKAAPRAMAEGARWHARVNSTPVKKVVSILAVFCYFCRI